MICTTPEQSRMLIKAGIDVSTSDLLWYRDNGTLNLVARGGYCRLWQWDFNNIPSWSFGALWQLCKELDAPLTFSTDDEETTQDTMANMVEHLVKTLPYTMDNLKKRALEELRRRLTVY